MKKTSFSLLFLSALLFVAGLLVLLIPRAETKSVVAERMQTEETKCNEAQVSYLSLDGYDGAFAFGEEINLEGVAHNAKQISDIQTSGEGFDVLGLWQRDDGFELSVAFVSTENPPMIEILCQLDDGGTLSTAVYGYIAEDKLFLGEGNLDAAFESYCGYARENHTIPDPDLKQLRSKFYNACVTTTVTTSPSKMRLGNATIDGHIYWIDDQKVIEGSGRNNQHICAQVKVELCFLENGKEVKSKNLNTTTSDRGYYSFTFSAPDNTDGIKHEFFIRTYCENAKSSIKVVSEEGAEYPIESDKVGSVYANTVTHIQLDINMSTTSGQAMQITQAIIYAEKYAIAMSGKIMDNVSIIYPDNSLDTSSSLYRGFFKEIHICRPALANRNIRSYSSWDVIMHEYGHHVQTHFDISDNPGISHDFQNTIITLLLDRELEAFVKKTALRSVWAEGWATFFGILAQDYFRNELTDIPTVGDFGNTSYNGAEYLLHGGEGISHDGEASEASMIDVMLDIFDDETDGDNLDEISLGHQGVWDMVIESKAKTLNDFVQYMYRDYYAYERMLSPILQRAHITSDNVSCIVDDFTKTSPISELQIGTRGGFKNKITNPDREVDYTNNVITAHFYDKRGDLLFTMDPGTMQLTFNNFKKIMDLDSDVFSVELVEYQDDGYMRTGPYYSFHTVQRPEPPELKIGEPQTVTLSSTHVFEIFTFVAPSSGTYSFYTEHNQYTSMTFWGQLYSRPVISTDNPSAYRLADHWPGSGDFKINYALTAGQRVYLRANSRNSSGTFTVNVKKI